MQNKTGKISVHTENIFPIIKKFLYSDHEIFLRELVSNAVDACQKLKTLSSIGEANMGDAPLKVSVHIDKENKTLTIRDNGIGMSAEEIEQYINQLAFSGAEAFVEKYKDKADANIIGHFGLGFYSGFMVASQVEIQTKSYKDAPAAHWTCDGSTSFTLAEGNRTERGTDIILHINEESAEFLETYRIQQLLSKYCKFLPISIEFEEKTINNTHPIWTKKPSELTEEDYTSFYSELYPMAPAPLFWIHLNVDYPFNLTGVLYFPKITNSIDAEKHKVQLYCNQVFVTDNVKDILPEFLMLLHGVIDSPDIPLNVSRSSLQSDTNVKKITQHISKKVSDKLKELFKNDRADFEKKWSSMDVFVKYGMLSDEKFAERAQEFCLLENTQGIFTELKEYVEKVKIAQTDKDDNAVILYTNNVETQHSYLQAATNKGYDVLKLEGILDNHFVNYIEQHFEKVKVKRIDADSIEQLIDKGTKRESVLNEEDTKKITALFESIEQPKIKLTVKAQALAPEDSFVAITEDEFMRRMKDMSVMQGMSMFGDMPTSYNLIINSNHPKATSLLSMDEGKQKASTQQLIDLALLSKQLLQGEQLTQFINRSIENL
ncbi:MAG: molecular chaperone HtpG [Chitinophagia bacterium]|jgi:molecular chaperone HtpG|nr:molecular chaperone HtpG [Chitinophagia bacterium]